MTVEAGITLTVDPGTTVQFQALNDDQGGGADPSRPELIIEGTLVADGTVTPIVFTSNAGTPAAGDWGGIRHSGSGALTVVDISGEDLPDQEWN